MGCERYNVIVNERLKVFETMSMNREKQCKRTSRQVDDIADKLVRDFNAPASRAFFCKCAWKLSENDIWTTKEYACRPEVKNPLKYFVHVCSDKMKRCA